MHGQVGSHGRIEWYRGTSGTRSPDGGDALPNDSAPLGVQRGKQRSRAPLVVSPSFQLARAQRQQRQGAIRRPDFAMLTTLSTSARPG